ncbi:BLUF domain-containing protein [Flavobacterium difficile]|uniref:BLUF domain-containing protein n=1 Tax=Flavobacterium difficile TaxID=2709659 RepID=A0ABX0I335_9FLAO|nr:BLUF domain-containing protein [Flavobacterium difficile]NHM01599.1 BLUF domain-containing protein [Flavobacterium difficile]
MKHIIYLSSATELLSDQEINLLLKTSRENNKKNNITGLLLYCDGNFLQVLEGENEVIDAIFSIISTDRRHKNIIVVANECIEKRSFEEWKMGYSVVDKNFLIQNKEINPFQLSTTNNLNLIVKTFIDIFLKSHRSRILYN